MKIARQLVGIVGALFLLSAEAKAQYLGWVDEVKDAADGDSTVPCYGEVYLRGWAANQSGSGLRPTTPGISDCRAWATAACSVTAYEGAVGDGEFWFLSYPRSWLWQGRGDVQNAFGRADFLFSGFEVVANAGRNWCHVGSQSYVIGAYWGSWPPAQLNGSGSLTVVRNDVAEAPGIVSLLDQSRPGWQSSGTTTFWGNTSSYVNNYSRSTQTFWGLCTDATGKDAVWKFKLTSTRTITISTAESAFDTVLYVIRSDNTNMGCNDDFGGVTSQVTLSLAPGEYYVFLDGYNAAAAGNFQLKFTW